MASPGDDDLPTGTFVLREQRVRTFEAALLGGAVVSFALAGAYAGFDLWRRWRRTLRAGASSLTQPRPSTGHPPEPHEGALRSSRGFEGEAGTRAGPTRTPTRQAPMWPGSGATPGTASHHALDERTISEGQHGPRSPAGVAQVVSSLLAPPVVQPFDGRQESAPREAVAGSRDATSPDPHLARLHVESGRLQAHEKAPATLDDPPPSWPAEPPTWVVSPATGRALPSLLVACDELVRGLSRRLQPARAAQLDELRSVLAEALATRSLREVVLRGPGGQVLARVEVAYLPGGGVCGWSWPPDARLLEGSEVEVVLDEDGGGS